MKERRSKVKAGTSEPRESMLAKTVEELAEVLRRQDLTELSVESDGLKVHLKRGGVVAHAAALPVVAAPLAAAPAPAPAQPAPKAETSDGNVSYITSPFVGTFYKSPGPDAAPFVDVGTHVKKGQVLCIVEAMKLMNEIESEIQGTVVQVLLENGQPVEYGEPLFKIKQD
jgi:acetyl-CoA carboxylase biotin carboxyl carrier protein